MASLVVPFLRSVSSGLWSTGLVDRSVSEVTHCSFASNKCEPVFKNLCRFAGTPRVICLHKNDVMASRSAYAKQENLK